MQTPPPSHSPHYTLKRKSITLPSVVCSEERAVSVASSVDAFTVFRRVQDCFSFLVQLYHRGESLFFLYLGVSHKRWEEEEEEGWEV